jgi:hypothetical protein
MRVYNKGMKNKNYLQENLLDGRTFEDVLDEALAEVVNGECKEVSWEDEIELIRTLERDSLGVGDFHSKRN